MTLIPLIVLGIVGALALVCAFVKLHELGGALLVLLAFVALAVMVRVLGPEKGPQAKPPVFAATAALPPLDLPLAPRKAPVANRCR